MQLESNFSGIREDVTTVGENCHFIPNINTPTLPKFSLWCSLALPIQMARRILTRKVTLQICLQMQRQKLWGQIPLSVIKRGPPCFSDSLLYLRGSSNAHWKAPDWSHSTGQR